MENYCAHSCDIFAGCLFKNENLLHRKYTHKKVTRFEYSGQILDMTMKIIINFVDLVFGISLSKKTHVSVFGNDQKSNI